MALLLVVQITNLPKEVKVLQQFARGRGNQALCEHERAEEAIGRTLLQQGAPLGIDPWILSWSFRRVHIDARIKHALAENDRGLTCRAVK
jgi:hypothetical protein